MPRQCWSYADGVPVIEVMFQPPDGSDRVMKILDVDCGASGGVTCLVLDENNGDLLGIMDGPSVQDIDVNGNVVVRRTVWVLVDMPALNLRELMLAKCYLRAPGLHQGLVTLNFLDGYFDRWAGEKDSAGNYQFCLERSG